MKIIKRKLSFSEGVKSEVGIGSIDIGRVGIMCIGVGRIGVFFSIMVLCLLLVVVVVFLIKNRQRLI